jgi:hypothetical protein
MKPSERRRHPRYRSKIDAYAVLCADAPVLAQLIDISEGGLSVWYVDGQGEAMDAEKVDLFLMNSPYRISGLPVETTSDFETRQDAASPERLIRRRCFRFGHLLTVQKNAVADFISYHTEIANA